ncbi:MAG: RNA polymerase factor sigma-54 [Proteobacteria bacterium]|nr:RNA polymerase factor sigma-54 [Pseudomonadota bacterium]
MALAQRLEMRQGQSLVMTPQLQQAIKLLQLSNLELANYVEQELEKNPLLERDEREHAPDEQKAETASTDSETLDAALSREDFSKSDDMDISREDLHSEDFGSDSTAPQSSSDWSNMRSAAGPALGEDGESAIERTLAQAATLRDHLTDQLSIAGLDGERRLIGASLVDAIDEAGYCRADLDEMATRLVVPRDTVEEVLKVIQGFEPTGVGARDLAECLGLQLKELGRLDPIMQAFLTNLELVAKRDVTRLCELCGCDSEDIADMIAEIRELTPKPGLAFGSEPVQPVVPDVFVREGNDGGWHVELNSDTLPRLLVNQRYYTKINGSARDKDSKAYITDCLNNANWLVKSLDQRARTIMKVATEIVRQQDGFLTYGVRHLRPLNLRTIADAITMHESTVSRVTSNKYISTPRGLFELKYFFTASIQAVNGTEAHSAEAVRDRIREMIDNEAAQVLSDDRIVALLTADGVNIARRTVAKYREAMRIPSSVERRRMKTSDFSLAAGR